MHVQHLPEDVLIDLFQYVDLWSLVRHVRLVCRLFHALCFRRRTILDVTTWQHKESFNWHLHHRGGASPNASTTHRILSVMRLVSHQCFRSGSQLKHVRLDKSYGLSRILRNEVSFRQIFDPLGHQIESLSMVGCVQVNDTVLSHISQCDFSTNGHLSSLNLSGNRPITDRGIQHIAERCRGLRHLYLRGLYRLTNSSLISLWLHLGQQIETLDLHGLKSDMQFDTIAQFTNLKHLTLQDSSISGVDIERVLSSRVAAVTSSAQPCLQHLQTLNLIGVSAVSDLTVRLLFEQCTSLRHFEVQNNELITDDACEYMRGLSVLNIISCRGIGDRGIVAIADHNPQLQRLEMKGLQLVSEDAVLYLMSVCSSHLRVLNVSHTEMGNRVLEEAKQAKRLRLLNLSMCDRVVPSSLASVHML